jgi:hypothetical protein
VEEPSVGVLFAEISNMRTLVLASMFDYCPAEQSPFELRSDVKFGVREGAGFLHHLEQVDDCLGHEELELGVGD